jgi:hypothetical protein
MATIPRFLELRINESDPSYVPSISVRYKLSGKTKERPKSRPAAERAQGRNENGRF